MTDLQTGSILCVLLVGGEHLDIIQMSFRHRKFKKMPASSTLMIQSGCFIEIVWTCSDVGSYF